MTRPNLGILRRLFQYLRPYRVQLAGAALALLVASSTVLALGKGIQALVDKGFAARNPELLHSAALAMLGIIALLAAASYARLYLVSWLGERLVADLRSEIYRHLLTLSPAFYETNRTGEMISRLTTDTTLVQTVVSSAVPIALRNLVMFCGGIVLLAAASAKLTGMVLLGVPLVILPVILFGRRVRGLSRQVQEKVATSGAHIEESLNAVRTVQAFSNETRDGQQFRAKVEDSFQLAICRNRFRGMLAAAVIAIVFGAITAILWIGGQDVLAGRMTAGELTSFIFYAVVVSGSVNALTEIYGDLQKAAGAAERLFELRDAVSPVAVPAAPQPLPLYNGGGGLELGFEDVTFAYPLAPHKPVLRNFALTIAPGETLALVGPSGSGKSTLFHLLLRFYDPLAGRVLLGGQDIRQFDPVAYRKLFAVVSQEPFLFSTSVRENILYGDPNASSEAVIDAARRANALTFIERLSDGFETHVGEKGVRLSGGQKQRIAIARALLRQPRVLLLDEATSALDSLSEQQVATALEELQGGMTRIIIAHRLSTVRKADRIIVLNEGRIEAIGRHNELLEVSPLYAKLAALQFGSINAISDATENNPMAAIR
jgi:ATP-binding cassette subfamily B protein